jgi:AcrR family transcriptional regulator
MTGGIAVKRGRGGRPPAGQAGDVEARLLAAATRLFLERGYDGTSCDQVALDAGAGKASIYARYANKDALFCAVIDNLLARSYERDEVASELPLRERLATVGMRVVADALHPDALALLRLVVTGLARFANTGVRAEQLFWQAAVQRAAAAIAARKPDTIEQAVEPAQQFIELVLMPPLMRALLGEPATTLITSAPRRIDVVIAALATSGALDHWT